MDLAAKKAIKVYFKILSFIAIGIVMISVAIFVFIVKSGISLVAVSGNSMEPTFHDRESIILKQESLLKADQIIIFHKPKSWSYETYKTDVLIKRVKAVPGDTLTYDGKAFYVNGETVFTLSDVNYKCDAGEVGYSHTLAGNEAFVMGDNANESLDSRRIFCDGKPDDAFVKKTSLIDYGKVVFKL